MFPSVKELFTNLLFETKFSGIWLILIEPLIAWKGIIILALPSKSCPAIFTIFFNFDAVDAFPLVSTLPIIFTPGKSIDCVPSNCMPPILCAVFNFDAVKALPFTFPLTVPLTFYYIPYSRML